MEAEYMLAFVDERGKGMGRRMLLPVPVERTNSWVARGEQMGTR